MPMPAFFKGILSMLRSLTVGGKQGPVVPLSDWPLPAPIAVLLLAPPAEWPLQYGGNRRDIQIVPYPFDTPELAALVEQSSSPDMSAVRDGKYCEFIGSDRSVRYFGCRMLIDALERAERSVGKGMSRLRWVALDQFGYADEAVALYRRFEQELGSTMTATGVARMLMNRCPQRSLELIEEAQRSGITGAAMSACHARVLFACGHVSEGMQAAALALRQLPDPFWMPADHVYSWGLLHGAAAVSVTDPSLRQDVLAAVQSLAEGAVSARRVLACAELYEISGDVPAATHYAEVAARMAGADDIVSEGADAMLQRVGAKVARHSDPIGLQPEDMPLAVSTPTTLTDTDEFSDEVVVKLGPVFEGPDSSDVTAVRNYCRQLADTRDGALVEANVVQVPSGPAIQMIYKQPAGLGFQFTGVHFAMLTDATRISTVVAAEDGTTGVREAAVTAHLMQEGKLTIATYKASWARDPYDASYSASGRLPLRFISDDVVYDRMFSAHPLSRVRRALHNLACGHDTPERK
jgi:hypothetical protein